MPVIRRMAVVWLLLGGVPARATDRVLLVMPLVLSEGDSMPPATVVSALDRAIRETSSNVLAGSGWSVAPLDRLARALVQRELEPAQCTDFSCFLPLAQELKAVRFLTASLHLVEGRATLSLRLIDTRSVRVVTTEEFSDARLEALAPAFEARAKSFYVRASMLSAVAPAPTPPKALRVHQSRLETKTGLELISFEGGAFKYGCEDKDEHCFDDEKPALEATVGAFWLGRTEVSVAAYEKCMRAGVCGAPTSNGLGIEKCNWTRSQKQPVNCVTWDQAQQFCRWIGGDLPTAEQWEYAAKDGDGHVYPWGNQEPDSELANFDTGDTTRPGKYPKGATPAGLLDMAGNVWEWTATESANAGSMQIRGGGYNVGARQLRNSARGVALPFQGQDSIGFRCRL